MVARNIHINITMGCKWLNIHICEWSYMAESFLLTKIIQTENLKKKRFLDTLDFLFLGDDERYPYKAQYGRK